MQTLTPPDVQALGDPPPAAQQAPQCPAPAPPNAELVEFLAWVAGQPRVYAEAMEVWQTSCPRHSVWEDALAEQLVQVDSGHGRPMGQALVILTPEGRAVLAGK